MFDKSVPEPRRLAGLTAAELIDAAEVTGRAENAACARKLAVMAEFFIRRIHLAPEDRLDWWVDPDAAVTAEIAAAFGITQGLALHQTYRGVVLRDKLPKIGALFLDGLITDLMVRAIINRTALILRDDIIATVDADLADHILSWGPLSAKKTDTEIDDIVARHDPDALRQSRQHETTRAIAFGQPHDAPGFTSVNALMFACDAAAGERTLTAMAYSVCDDDPRSIDDRRNDAYAALMQGITTLACQCGRTDCQTTLNPRPLRDITLYAITDHTTAGAKQAQTKPAHEAAVNVETQAEAEAAVEAEVEEKATPVQTRPGYLFGSGFMPAPLFAAIIDGTKAREIIHPGQAAPEPGRFPSAALAAFIRCRDLTCRFPGCDKPATTADIDHTVAHPIGPTHASNLKALCRFHHLLKTFWGGATGWRDRQLPDGTIIWTAPTGHTYTTHPGSKTLYPTLCLPTATLWTGDPPDVPTATDKCDKRMPRRTKTRAQGRAAYIAAQRLRNRTERLTQIALDNGEEPPADYDFAADPRGYGNDPPPF